MQSLAPFPGVHNGALCFLSGKTQQVDSFYEFTSPGHRRPPLLLPNSPSLPPCRGKEARGYAENKIRYSNMFMCSATSSCVFFFFFRWQPSPTFSACKSEKNVRRVNPCVITCFKALRRACRTVSFSADAPEPRFSVTVNNPSIQ